MSTIDQQIRAADEVIVRNIESLTDHRDLLSQNVLSQLRNLVEGMVVRAHKQDGTATFMQSEVGSALDFVRADAKWNVLSRFHHRLQASTSHYTLGGDPSERLMLKYYEYLIRLRDLALKRWSMTILHNLERFPLEIDESVHEYYEKIADRVVDHGGRSSASTSGVYYVHHSRPFFVRGRIFYEVTFSHAHNRASKSDRYIGFTDIDLTDKYAARLELSTQSIDVIGQKMPIVVIRSWWVAIRGCEFDNLAKLLFGPRRERVRANQNEYRNLMRYLTETRSNLLDLVDMDDVAYRDIRSWALHDAQRSPLVFTLIDEARRLIRAKRAGHNLLRFLMLRMNNQVIKDQYSSSRCSPLSNLWVSHSCRPFDTMPFCSSPAGHKASFGDLAEALDSSTRRHEILARRIQSNVDVDGRIYTPDSALDGFGDLDALAARHNALLPPNNARHARRTLIHENGHVFIKGYEDDTVQIVNELQAIAADGVAGYTADVDAWLNANPFAVDDPVKEDALRALFAHSKVALIYGAAGTGKSRMVDHIAKYFESRRKLFLAHTNPAVDNLRNRVTAGQSEFSTIHAHVKGNTLGGHYDVLVIDECSTVSNASLLEVLDISSFELLVLVGDVYQIEAIEFGNWFGSIRSYLPETSVFELVTPWRTRDPALLTLWDRVRNLDDRIEESLAKEGYSTTLSDQLFASRHEDEIVLCINYDGLYGINNVNRFLQVSNPNSAVVRRGVAYKVGDPVLFNDTNRFRGIIFNNLKGRITAIAEAPGKITFDIELFRDVSPEDLWGTDLRFVEGTTVQFDVFEMGDSDEDDDTAVTIVPFQIAYAVSFHKAQGLEYDSVKVVITEVNEDRFTHAMFYTAITRARRHLEIYWTPGTQKRVLNHLVPHENTRDDALLRARRGVIPVSKRPKMPKPRTAP